MARLWSLLRYDWPLHFVLLLTNWIPDNVVFLRMRGWLAHWFIGKCGSDLRVGRNIVFYNPSSISLGSSVYIAYGCVILAVGDVFIEDEVMLGPYVVISAGNHSRQNSSYRYGCANASSISIGKGTWMGSHVSVLGGSHIGKGCLVASQACVTKGFLPDNAFIVGVPAVVKKYLDGTNDTE
jgi:acetyltransferase-like isoleucine patch superfamily enzyme